MQSRYGITFCEAWLSPNTGSFFDHLVAPGPLVSLELQA
jgi:hypothetical protein